MTGLQEQHGEEILFSSRDGYVWVSWPKACAVRLGHHKAVTAGMRDFLAQDALGKRLSKQYGKSP